MYMLFAPAMLSVLIIGAIQIVQALRGANRSNL